MKKLTILLLIISSCTAQKTLHQTGTYTVATATGNVVTFKGIAGKYHLPVDTMKVGDTIRMNVIRLTRKN